MKQWIATLFLLTLFIMVIVTALNENNQNEVPQGTTADTESENTGMTAPNAPDGLQVGEKAPDFTLMNLDGEKVNLSDYKGKKIFLNYWTTWCPPCREEMPEMQKFHDKYGEEVVILAVNGTGTEESVEKVQQFINKGSYTFPVVLDEELKLNQTYQIISIPTTYFIGTDGVIQSPRIVGPMTYEMMEEKKKALN